jgi:hypothetical protein
MTEPFDPRKTDAFEALTPEQVAAAAAAVTPDPAPVDEDGAPADARLTAPPRSAKAAPPPPPGFFKRFFYDADGRLNRKSVALAAGFGALALVFVFSGGEKNAPDSKSKPSKSAAAGASDARSANVARQLVSGTPESVLAAGAAPAPSAAAHPPAAQPTAPQPPFGAPPSALAPTPANPAPPKPAPGKPGQPSAPPVADAQAAPASRSFVIPLRDAARPTERAAAKAPADAAPETDALQPPTIPRGTRIPLRLLEPLVTGAAAPAAAVVLEDVLTESGEVLIPRGTRAEIPFMGYDANGRIPNNRAQPALFLVPDVPGGLSAKGGVKGLDGRAGLSGTVTQERPGFLKRMLGASARVGTAAVGSLGPGDVTGEVERAAGLDSVATISPAGRRVCEVPKGAPFVFIVGF